ncbi:hypothetical protein PR202_ga18372 [Eleusine coracana subsp. coracana]|uniref:Uncharacterized protein n=1 Tax=Eleusine coracana subsp. coracana TaxID=191504 RepID=A0AAV5CT02_ELECO|nr:hypothetical protein PR202_ga18372 [Eleusine coracana subsp. coracana]
MFSNPTILVSIPEACKQVLMYDENFVTGWPKATVALIGPKSFMAMPYEEHRRPHKLTAAPINVFDALTTYLGFIDRTVTASLCSLSSSQSNQIEFLTELRRMTFKIIVQIFLGGASDATMRALERSCTDLNYGMSAMAIDLPGFAYYKALRARKKLVAVLQSMLDDRRKGVASMSSSVDMMDRLIQVEDENGRRLRDDEIIDILIMYLNAGHESSGHITMWATVFFQENLEIFAKAKAEQETIMRSIPPTHKRRFCQGYLIPKGWKVQLWYTSMHMDPEVYSEPKKFNPSRWEAQTKLESTSVSQGLTPRAGTFLPFGLGARLCPGNDLAKLEISVFLHHFLLGYKLTRANPNCRIRYLPHHRPVDNCLATITEVSRQYRFFKLPKPPTRAWTIVLYTKIKQTI